MLLSKKRHMNLFIISLLWTATVWVVFFFPSVSSIIKDTAYPTTEPRTRETPKLFDLHRITDPYNELVADQFYRLHDNIYKTKSRLSDGSGSIVFAFKTECRPVTGRHGQQGWPEVAMNTFQAVFIENDTAPYPRSGYARGAVLAITNWQYYTAFDFDRCGLIKDLPMVENALGRKLVRGAERRNNQGNPSATILLIGVAITWEERYSDDYFPQAPKYAPYFVVPPVGAIDSSRGRVSRHELLQMSDIFVFDYLLMNPDRHIEMEKNWFLDKATMTNAALLDNGWDFGGEDFISSVCRVESSMLYCPTAMEGWTQSGYRKRWSCRPSKRHTEAKKIEWCRFRPETLRALDRTRNAWHASAENTNGSAALSTRWTEVLLADPLVSFLLNAYGSEVEPQSNGRLLYSKALGRYIHNCPPPTDKENTAPKTNEGESGTAVGPSTLLRFLQLGIKARMDRLARHAEECTSKYGERYVYGLDI